MACAVPAQTCVCSWFLLCFALLSVPPAVICTVSSFVCRKSFLSGILCMEAFRADAGLRLWELQIARVEGAGAAIEWHVHMLGAANGMTGFGHGPSRGVCGPPPRLGSI